MALLFKLVLSILDMDLLDLELDATKFDNVMLLQCVLLLHVSISDVTHDQVDLLKSIVGVLQLLT